MSGETACQEHRKTGVFLDFQDFPFPDGLDPKTDLHDNVKSGLEKKGFLVDIVSFFLYCEELRLEDDTVEIFEEAGIIFPETNDDKISRAGWMLHDIGFWMLDNLSPDNHLPLPSNIVIVSNTIAEEAEFVDVLKLFRSKGHKVLLVRECKEAESELPEETCQWLWDTILPPPPGSSESLGAPKTGIFWDLEDYPFPDGFTFVRIHENINRALRVKGYLVDTSSLVFYDNQDIIEEEILEWYKAGGITICSKLGKTGRVKSMLEGIRKWADENPVQGDEKHNLMLASQGILNETEIMSVVNELKSKGYQVEVVHDKETSKWLWRSVFY